MIIAAVLSLPFLAVLLTRPVLRRLAVRNAIRRPRETLLVIAGSLLATALMTAAFVVGDTFDASLRANAYTQLGPVDEMVNVPVADSSALDRVAALRSPDIDGTLRVTLAGASAATFDGRGLVRAAAPKTQLLELDFAAARGFGGDPSVTGISGPSPGAGSTVLTRPLADRLHVGPGATITVWAWGASTRLRVERVLPQRGLAGLWTGREFLSYNAFVAPGTIARLAGAGPTTAAPPQATLLVSNRGGVESGAARTSAVLRALQTAFGSRTGTIETVKRDALDAATQAGKSLRQIYQLLGFFAVAAGVLLLINIFLMLAEERQSELGMLRAMGLKRRSLVSAFAAEGWLYAVVACALGTIVGLGVARLVMAGASRLFNERDADFRLPIRFHFKIASLQSGFTLGFVIAMVTVVATSVAISRFNIISAIRDLEREKRAPRHWTVAMWSVVAALGGALLAAGVARHAVTSMLIGGGLVAVGLRFSLRFRVADRAVRTATALAALAWGVAAIPVASVLGGDLPIAAFLVQGMMLVIASVVLVSEYQREIGLLLSHASRKHLAVRLGMAYPLARRQRTSLTLAQFSIVVFVLVYISVMAQMFGGQVSSLLPKVGGQANVLIESSRTNPVPFEQLTRSQGAQAVAPLLTEPADIVPPHTAKSTRWTVTGFDASLLALGAPTIGDSGRFPNDAAAWRYVLTHPDTAMVDHSFLSQRSGPPSSPVGVGDHIRVTDPLSGRSQTLLVVARSEDDWLGNGAWTSAATIRSIFGADAVASRAYVRVGATDAAPFARTIEARYYANGAKADPIRSLVEQRLSRQVQFFTLMRAFLAVGLVIGVAGIGVIMVRAVRERRRQVGILRSLGFPAAQVSNAFAIEALFVAFEGVCIGVALGLVCTWSITLTDSFGSGLSWRVPLAAVGALVGGTLVGALFATFGPARSASRIKPAVALRIAD